MTDPAEPTDAADGRTPGAPSPVDDLRRLVEDSNGLGRPERVEVAIRWADAALASGVPAATVRDAATMLSPASEPAILAAGACAALQRDEVDTDSEADHAADLMVTRLATLRLVACAVGSHEGGQVVRAEVPTSSVGDPFHEFLDAALAADPDRAEAAWCVAASVDRALATQMLLSAGAAGFHLDERRLVLATGAATWSTEETADAVARTAARRVADAPQDPDHASMRRADAAVLAADAIERAPATFGRLPRVDHDRLSILATGIALTPSESLPHLLLASLEDGLAPEDLAEAVLLLRAAALAITDLGGDEDRSSQAVRSCAGADAVRRSIEAAHSPELRYELALCAPEGPSAAGLDAVAELWVPPFDDGALGDLVVALEEADPDAAAEAATAVPPDDRESVDAAWRAVTSAAVRSTSPTLDALVHVVTMACAFRATAHPARIWLLAAAARVAGGAGPDGGAHSSMSSEFLSRPS